MIDDTTTATTNEICKLAAITKQYLGRLEGVGIVRRSGRDQWPLVVTLNVLFQQARARSEAQSEAKIRIETARAKALELKVAREEGKLAPLDEWYAASDIVTAKILEGLDAMAPRLSRDVAERKRVDSLIRELRSNVADWLVAEGTRLEAEARKSARRRL
jgi:hypothetical protein